jgi:hypothetical protein
MQRLYSTVNGDERGEAVAKVIGLSIGNPCARPAEVGRNVGRAPVRGEGKKEAG